MVKNRIKSYLIITVIYVFAIILGIWVYNLLSFDLYLNLLIADVISTIFVFIFSLILKNASVYDPYWSVQPIVIVLALGIEKGFNLVSLLLSLVVLIWGIRLTTNWAYTFHSFEYEDWRYRMLREKTKVFYPLINLLGIHMFPTLVVYLCVLPIVFTFEYACTLNVVTIIGLVISIFAFSIQGIADIQMHKFRKKKSKGLIREGLWKYSRHPNYLGEILMWWGVGIAVVSVLPQMFFLLIGAIVNTLMFLFVSIPMADKRQSRKEGYEQYKEETRMLLPIRK